MRLVKPKICNCCGTIYNDTREFAELLDETDDRFGRFMWFNCHCDSTLLVSEEFLEPVTSDENEKEGV